MADRPQGWSDAEALAESVIRETGGRVVLALPLGIGKPNTLVNAIYRRARADRSVSLTIFTALTLNPPEGRSVLERRFIEPVAERLFADHAPLDYAADMRRGDTPDNIEVREFFLAAGQWLGVPAAQQNHVSANYTDVLRYILDSDVNVVGQLVAGKQEIDERKFSLGSNPDITLPLLQARRDGRAAFRFVAEVNGEMPWMGRDAEIDAAEFDDVLRDGEGFALFGIPKGPVSLADHAAGIHAARLVPDGGTLQIGIGSIGDAVANALILRHRDNARFREIVARLGPADDREDLYHDGPFEEGIYAASEMLVEGLLRLIRAGVIRREVDGCLVHSAFFVGSRAYQAELRDLSRSERDLIGMTDVGFVNGAATDLERKRRERPGARFINKAMMATLTGAAVSDGLENGQVVSGVGGQFDFVQQAFALPDARSVLMLDATRQTSKGAESNILWSYGHQTVPRQMRDIVVTEYGVADMRGRTDARVIGEMLSVADARFQDDLVRQAKAASKLPSDFRLPVAWRRNTPATLAEALGPAAEAGLLPTYPFGTEYTEAEQALLPALAELKRSSGSPARLARLVWRGLRRGRPDSDAEAALARMGLSNPAGLKERLWRHAIHGALDRPEPSAPGPG
ncbi:acetyl-CoA hydrolase/transferase C-terminal domain-containing protein [Minwuia thermotolerans]|uniref:Acetyl-CoA hydrolase n=1 Tax=Minwuia thermotolerans TaxID=2056226 RepID=A0A2M9FXY7_9PROT|nr:acetyl-CoA hydrolase/transferase C-terminal domain-containing protein [Minwuia thermotolerans]PJK28299.1 acetyl-CoA hydrolase [Minwuia thermotolerans]